jgi:predicted  nucleic acid-binding Zn-ribbon protein
MYDRIARALVERNTPPDDVKRLQEENLIRQRELEEIEQQLTAHSDELREVRRREEEAELELEHFQRQKGMVTNEREFTAVISEIDYATKARDEAAGRRRELEEEITNLNHDLEARRKARPEEEAAQREVVRSWEDQKDQLKELVHGLAAETKELEADLQPAHRARFLRLLESRKGTAVAAVVDGSCSLCHFSLRPHLQQRVRRVQEIISCEHCHRILYFADMDGLESLGDNPE